MLESNTTPAETVWVPYLMETEARVLIVETLHQALFSIAAIAARAQVGHKVGPLVMQLERKDVALRTRR